MQAQILILAAWLAVGGSLLGWGLLLRRLTGTRTLASDLWLTFWLGWAALLAFLQLWHGAFPVDDRARAVTLLVGIVGLGLGAPALARRLGREFPGNLPALLAVAACAAWLSNQALAGPRFGDTGLYFIPSAYWNASYPIVPGLANLYVPLGHNLSYFLYLALLDAGPFAHRPYHIVNSLLVLALLARGLVAIVRLVRGDAPAPAVDLFYALALVPGAALVAGLFFTSPSADTAVQVMGFVLAGELMALVTAARPTRARLLALVLLGAVGITIKLSLAAFAGATMATAFAWWLARARPSWPLLARSTILAGAIALVPVGTWIARNIVISGCPLWPSMVGALPVPWRADMDATAWIRKPMEMAPLSTILQQPWWFQQRLISLGWAEPEVLEPLVLMLVALMATAAIGCVRWWRGRPGMVPALVLLPPLVSFAFCFVNTPMPRYQGATIWILAIEALVLAGAAVFRTHGRLAGALTVAAVAAGSALPYVRGAPAWLPIDTFETVSPYKVAPRQLASGLVVNVPETPSQLCWYAPLPCTPEPDPRLALREPGNIARGFVIDRSLAIELPAGETAPPDGRRPTK